MKTIFTFVLALIFFQLAHAQKQNYKTAIVAFYNLENFYDTIDHLTDAIASGKYPSPPARNLGFLFKGKPSRPELVAFVKFVLNEGQKYVDENGYIQLSKQKIAEELKKVN